MSVPGAEPAVFEIGSGVVVALSLAGGQVQIQWPHRASLLSDDARALGYLLRSYASLAEQDNELDS